jgi:LDH2 family malate/lactate/ureidoglycolate dehydrogenase
MYNKMDKPTPTGWAVNKEGVSSNSAAEVLGNIRAAEGGGIVPLGGDTEQLGGHKGYGYGLICELFSSILSQGFTSPHTMRNGFSGICHGFMAINPAFFGDPEAIKAHFSKYLQELRESPKADGAERIYTHGEKEMEACVRVQKEGIRVNENTVKEMIDMAEYLGMDVKAYFGDFKASDDKFKSAY